MSRATLEICLTGIFAAIIVLTFTSTPAQSQIPNPGTTEANAIQNLIDDLSAARGKQIYEGACAACHGRSGNGRGPAAQRMNPLPRDFTTGIFKFRSTPTGELPTDSDMSRSITEGIPGSMMPAWGDLLSTDQIRDVVIYLKRFTDDFETFGQGSSIIIPEEPIVTASSLEEGQFLYMVMECSSCHGSQGRGKGSSAGGLLDEWGHKIKPFDFTSENYKAGSDGRSIYTTFTTGLDGTPMPSFESAFAFGGDTITDFTGYKTVYSENEIQKLKAYLASQPTNAELEDISPSQVQELTSGRKWSLVHFVQSLGRNPGLLHRFFQHDYEETQ